MQNKYYDLYDEPHMLDIILDEALNKIQENVKETVKLKLEKLEDLDEKIDEKYKELVDLKSKISTAQKNLSEIEKKSEKLEEKMPKKYVNKFIHDAFGNLCPGDKVWVIKSEYANVTCDICEGAGKIKIVNNHNSELNCPKCSGKGTTRISYYAVEEDEVGEIRLRLYFDRESRVYYWNAEFIYLKSNNGCSTPLERIFENKAKALEECNLLNKEIKGIENIISIK